MLFSVSQCGIFLLKVVGYVGIAWVTFTIPLLCYLCEYIWHTWTLSTWKICTCVYPQPSPSSLSFVRIVWVFMIGRFLTNVLGATSLCDITTVLFVVQLWSLPFSQCTACVLIAVRGVLLIAMLFSTSIEHIYICIDLILHLRSLNSVVWQSKPIMWSMSLCLLFFAEHLCVILDTPFAAVITVTRVYVFSCGAQFDLLLYHRQMFKLKLSLNLNYVQCSACCLNCSCIMMNVWFVCSRPVLKLSGLVHNLGWLDQKRDGAP